MRRFLLTKVAAQDILDIYNYIAADKPKAAANVREQLLSSLQRLGQNPGIGHSREDLTDRPLLFWPIGRYLIIYDPATRPVRIVRVLDGARDVAGVLSV